MRVRVGWVALFSLFSTAGYAWDSQGDHFCDGADWRSHPVYFQTITVCGAGLASMANVASGPWAGAVVAGTFEGTAHVGRFTLPSQGETDILLAHYDARGRVLWARSFGNAAREWASDVATDRVGNIYLLGNYSGALDFGHGVSLPPAVLGDAGFLTKFDPRGQPLWTLQLGNTVHSAKLAISAQGRVAATGAFQGGTEILGFPISGYGVFVAAIDPNGHARWVTSFRGAEDWIQAVSFDVHQNTAIWLRHAPNYDRTFLRRLDPLGAPLLDRRYMGRYFGDFAEEPQGMVADGAGNMFLVGQGYLGDAGDLTQGGFFLAKLAPTGDVQWIDRFSDREFKRVALTAWGQIRVAGRGPFKPNQNTRPLLVATYDPWGRPLSSHQFGDVLSVDGLDLDPWGATLVTGTVGSSSQVSPLWSSSVAVPEGHDQGASCRGSENALVLYVTKLAP